MFVFGRFSETYKVVVFFEAYRVCIYISKTRRYNNQCSINVRFFETYKVRPPSVSWFYQRSWGYTFGTRSQRGRAFFDFVRFSLAFRAVLQADPVRKRLSMTILRDVFVRTGFFFILS